MDQFPQTTINLLTGPQLIGTMFNWLLLGMMIVQTYIYHVSFPSDPLRLKLFVYGTLIFEIVQTALVTSVAFRYFVYGFGDDLGLLSYYSGWFNVPIMCGIMSATVQCFFAWRLWVLSRNYILVGSIVMIALEQLSMAIVGGVKVKMLTTSSDEATVIPVIDAWLAGSALADSIIAVAMTFFLSRAKRGIKASDALLDRLIVLVIETGTLTAVVAIVDLCLFTIKPKTYLHTVPVLILSKLYANTLLINFNNRAFRSRKNDSTVMSMSTFRPYQESNIIYTTRDFALGFDVDVVTETFTDNAKSDVILPNPSMERDERLSKRSPIVDDSFNTRDFLVPAPAAER